MFGLSMKQKTFVLIILGFWAYYTVQNASSATPAPVAQSNIKATIIFDMNGVLFDTDKTAAAKLIGMKNFISYMMTFHSPSKAYNHLFNFLRAIKPMSPENPASCHGQDPLPQLMCDWMTGVYSCQELLAIVDQAIKDNIYSFNNNAEKKLVHAIATFMFTPEYFVQAVKPLKHGWQIVRECAQQTDANGEKCYRLIIVSNWDTESFELLKQQEEFAEFFELFDDIVISGDAKKIKPDPTIFLDLFNKHNINPNEHVCLFIDDQPENIQTFESCGLKATGILCKSIKKVHKQLIPLIKNKSIDTLNTNINIDYNTYTKHA